MSWLRRTGSRTTTWRISIQPQIRWYRHLVARCTTNRSSIWTRKIWRLASALPSRSISKTVIRGGYGIGYMHYFRFGGESTLGYNGPYIVDATINQTPPNLGGRHDATALHVADTGPQHLLPHHAVGLPDQLRFGAELFDAGRANPLYPTQLRSGLHPGLPSDRATRADEGYDA